MRRDSAYSRWLALLALGVIPGCVATAKIAYTPQEIRDEVARRAPSLKRGDIIVPFEVGTPDAARARQVVRYHRTDAEKVRALAEALFDPAVFGLRYAAHATTTAQEALRSSEGNCLAVASVFVGLARSVGLKAFYIDASTRIHETRYTEHGMTVNVGHVTGLVQTRDRDIALDIEHLGRIRWYRIIDDVEAVAHFYNNRGFDIIEDTQASGSVLDWAAVERSFRLAVQVMPAFALGWNNLGIAAAHLGRYSEAIEDYQRSMRLDPTLAAPHHNLGSLYLQIPNDRAARDSFEAAARLDPRGPHIQYSLALARLRLHDRLGAVRALHQAIAIRGDYPEARALLHQLRSAGTATSPDGSTGEDNRW